MQSAWSLSIHNMLPKELQRPKPTRECTWVTPCGMLVSLAKVSRVTHSMWSHCHTFPLSAAPVILHLHSFNPFPLCERVRHALSVMLYAYAGNTKMFFQSWLYYWRRDIVVTNYWGQRHNISTTLRARGGFNTPCWACCLLCVSQFHKWLFLSIIHAAGAAVDRTRSDPPPEPFT